MKDNNSLIVYKEKNKLQELLEKLKNRFTNLLKKKVDVKSENKIEDIKINPIERVDLQEVKRKEFRENLQNFNHEKIELNELKQKIDSKELNLDNLNNDKVKGLIELYMKENREIKDRIKEKEKLLETELEEK